MRPVDSVDDSELHECFECGKRFDAPETRTCAACGGTLRNIGRPRDL